MTLEEAIRLLDPETTGEAIAEVEYYNGFSGKTAARQAITDACEIAVEAMRKQMPQKLICVEVEKCCPVCNEEICLIGDDGNYGNYCYNCGQALDWSDEE